MKKTLAITLSVGGGGGNMNKKPFSIVLIASLMVIIFCSVFPTITIANDAQIIVNTPKVEKGDYVDVTIKFSYSTSETDHWMCVTGFTVYEGGEEIYSQGSQREGFERGSFPCIGEISNFLLPTDNLEPSTHDFNVEIYVEERCPGMGQPYWVVEKSTDQKSFTIEVVPATTDSKAKTVYIKEIRGEAEVDRGEKDIWSKAEEGMVLREGDYLATGFDSEVDLIVNGQEVTIRELTQFGIKELTRTKNLHKTIVQLRMGSIRTTVHHEAEVVTDFEVVTPSPIISIRGTICYMKYDDKTKLTEVFVEKGEVTVSDKEGKNEVSVSENEYISVPQGETPQKPIPVSQIEKEERWWEEWTEEEGISSYLWTIGLVVISIVGVVIVLIKKHSPSI